MRYSSRLRIMVFLVLFCIPVFFNACTSNQYGKLPSGMIFEKIISIHLEGQSNQGTNIVMTAFNLETNVVDVIRVGSDGKIIGERVIGFDVAGHRSFYASGQLDLSSGSQITQEILGIFYLDDLGMQIDSKYLITISVNSIESTKVFSCGENTCPERICVLYDAFYELPEPRDNPENFQCPISVE